MIGVLRSFWCEPSLKSDFRNKVPVAYFDTGNYTFFDLASYQVTANTQFFCDLINGKDFSFILHIFKNLQSELLDFT